MGKVPFLIFLDHHGAVVPCAGAQGRAGGAGPGQSVYRSVRGEVAQLCSQVVAVHGPQEAASQQNARAARGAAAGGQAAGRGHPPLQGQTIQQMTKTYQNSGQVSAKTGKIW